MHQESDTSASEAWPDGELAPSSEVAPDSAKVMEKRCWESSRSPTNQAASTHPACVSATATHQQREPHHRHDEANLLLLPQHTHKAWPPDRPAAPLSFRELDDSRRSHEMAARCNQLALLCALPRRALRLGDLDRRDPLRDHIESLRRFVQVEVVDDCC